MCYFGGRSKGNFNDVIWDKTQDGYWSDGWSFGGCSVGESALLHWTASRTWYSRSSDVSADVSTVLFPSKSFLFFSKHVFLFVVRFFKTTVSWVQQIKVKKKRKQQTVSHLLLTDFYFWICLLFVRLKYNKTEKNYFLYFKMYFVVGIFDDGGFCFIILILF